MCVLICLVEWSCTIGMYIFGTSIPTMYIMYVHVYVCTITVFYTFVVVLVGMYVSFVR